MGEPRDGGDSMTVGNEVWAEERKAEGSELELELGIEGGPGTLCRRATSWAAKESDELERKSAGETTSSEATKATVET